jgi:hypothetical protein
VLTPEKFVAGFVKLIENLVIRDTVSEEELLKFYDLAARRATYDEITLAVSLRLLAEIERTVHDQAMKNMLRRCAQEIRIFAVRIMVDVGRIPEDIALQFSARLAIAVDAAAAGVAVPKGVLSALTSLVSVEKAKAKTNFNQEVDTLNVAYKKYLAVEDDMDEIVVVSDEHRVAHIAVLCHPEIYFAMTRKLFVQSARAPSAIPGQHVSPNDSVRDCFCMLVALATVALMNKNGKVVRSASGSGFSPELDSDSRAAERNLHKLLRECVVLLEQLVGVYLRVFKKESSAEMRLLKDGIEQSGVVAHGIVLWAREGLLTNVDSGRLLYNAVYYLELLEYVADRHPLLREDVLSLYADAYAHELWPDKTDPLRRADTEKTLRSYFSSALTSMLRLRMATRTVALYRSRFVTSEIDPMYKRRFLEGVLRTVAPPYAATFAVELLELIAAPAMVDANRDCLETGTLVTAFLDNISDYKQADRDTLRKVSVAYAVSR